MKKKLFILFSLILFCIGYCEERINFISSPGAEEEKLNKFRLPSGWGKYTGSGKAEFGISNDEFHSGKKSVYLKVLDYYFNEKTGKKTINVGIVLGESNGYNSDGAFEGKSGNTYYFSFWVKMKNIYKPLSIVPIVWDEVSGKRILYKAKIINGPVISVDEWKQFKGEFLFPMYIKGKFVILIQLSGDEEAIKKDAILWLDDVYVGTVPD